MPWVTDNLVAARHAPFGGAGDTTQAWTILGENLTGATLKLEIRVAPGETGTAPITLAAAAAGMQGISIAYDAGIVDPETGLTVGGTVLLPYITQANVEALPAATDPTQAITLFYDLMITPSGGARTKRIEGTFTVYPGETL